MVYELLPPFHAEYCEVFLNTGKTRIYGRHGGSIHLQIVRCIVQYSTLKNRPLHKKFSWKTLTSKRLGGKGWGICLAWWFDDPMFFVKYCIRWFIYTHLKDRRNNRNQFRQEHTTYIINKGPYQLGASFQTYLYRVPKRIYGFFCLYF